MAAQQEVVSGPGWGGGAGSGAAWGGLGRTRGAGQRLYPLRSPPSEPGPSRPHKALQPGGGSPGSSSPCHPGGWSPRLRRVAPPRGRGAPAGGGAGWGRARAQARLSRPQAPRPPGPRATPRRVDDEKGAPGGMGAGRTGRAPGGARRGRGRAAGGPGGARGSAVRAGAPGCRACSCPPPPPRGRPPSSSSRAGPQRTGTLGFGESSFGGVAGG